MTGMREPSDRHDSTAATRLDPYDRLKDAQSEDRYEDDPQAEPGLEELRESSDYFNGLWEPTTEERQ